MKLALVKTADAEQYAALRNGDDTYKWFFSEKQYKAEEIRQWLNRAPDRGDLIYFGVVDNTVIGTVSIYKIEERSAEAGRIVVAEDQRGNGYGVQMLRLAQKKAKELELNMLYAFIKKDNLASINTFKKAGYECEDDLEDRLYFSLTV